MWQGLDQAHTCHDNWHFYGTLYFSQGFPIYWLLAALLLPFPFHRQVTHISGRWGHSVCTTSPTELELELSPTGLLSPCACNSSIVWAVEGVSECFPALLSLLINAIGLTQSFSFFICEIGEIAVTTIYKNWRWLNHVNHLGQGLAHSKCSLRLAVMILGLSSLHFLGFASKRAARGLRLTPEALCSWIYIISRYFYPLLLW